MAPCLRLVDAGFCKLPDLDKLTRQRVLDLNDWLDAREEAEDEARRRADAEAKRHTRSGA
jgi:hypothetical protein